MIYALFLASGAISLVFQAAWMRDLSLVFGAGFEAQSIVLATLVAGLAAGGFSFGRRADRLARPLRVYGSLEIGVAVFGLALPLLLERVGAANLSAALRASGSDASRAVMALALLLPPAFCMGATLPVLARLRERVSVLYALHVFGAAIGALLAGFVLLPELGVWRSELVAALASLLIGAAAIGLDRAQPIPTGAGADSAAAGWPFRLAFWGAAVAGMASPALALVWWRAIAISTGPSPIHFTVMLAAFLSGVALGSFLHARVASRRFGVPVRMGVTLAGIGVASALAGLVIFRLPEAETTLPLSLLVILAPCIGIGFAFPLAAEARARLGLRAGRSVGDLVGLNAIGAIVGLLLAVLAGIPRLGLQRTMLLAAAACLGWGLLVLFAAWGAQRRKRRGLAFAGALAALPAAAAVALTLPGWDMHAFTGKRLLYLKEGRNSTVSVIGSERSVSLLVDGSVVATDSLDEVQRLYLLGHLPVLLHPDPRSALVVGLGAGLTLGGVAAHETVERIVSVGVEPAVRNAAQLFAGLHDDALADLRVELVWQDGRNYLATTGERFDVITADPIHPWARSQGYLDTTAYYRILAEHLRPGGIACQWLPLHELAEDELRSAVASFAGSFPHATLWRSAGGALLIGSNAPIAVDVDALEARLRTPGVARQLARVGLDDPLSLLAELSMDGAGADPGALIRDAGSRFASKDELLSRLASFRAAKSTLMKGGAPDGSSAPTRAELSALASRYREALEREPDYRQAKIRLAATLVSQGELHSKEGDAEAALALFRQALEVDPGNAMANLHVGVELSKREPERALAHFERAVERAPMSVNARAATAQAQMASKKFWHAIEHLQVAETLRPDSVEIDRLSCVCLRSMAELEAAIEKCREAQSKAPGDVQIAIELAYTLQLGRQYGEAVDTLRDALALEPGNLPVRLRLAWLLSTSPDPAARNGDEALGLVATAAERTENPRILDVAAAALAESGRYEQAAETAARAARLAAARGRSGLAERIRAHEAAYKAGQPLREEQ